LEKFAPEDYVVRAELYGVPQARHRVIIMGVRTDLDRNPAVLRQAKKTIPIEKAIGDLPRLRSGLSKEEDTEETWLAAVRTLAQSRGLSESAVSPDLRKAIKSILQKLKSGLNRGGEFVTGKPAPKFAKNWLRDPELHGFCNHATRGHIREDLHRYLFVSQYARTNKKTPGLEDFPTALLPNHENVAAAIAGTMFNDRFRVQFRGRPSTTVTSHISKDGHYFIHYDPTQCRSLTVREAARLQTFPDNYFFEGPRTAQYHQVGNAVPPLLAHQIAGIVAQLFT
jgi:DNA (cytosine-5)-methyltransferase 1